MLNPNPDHSLQALPGLAHLVGGNRGARHRVGGPKDYQRTSVAARCAHLTVPKSLHRPRDKHAERRLRGKNGTGRGENPALLVHRRGVRADPSPPRLPPLPLPISTPPLPSPLPLYCIEVGGESAGALGGRWAAERHHTDSPPSLPLSYPATPTTLANRDARARHPCEYAPSRVSVSVSACLIGLQLA